MKLNNNKVYQELVSESECDSGLAYRGTDILKEGHKYERENQKKDTLSLTKNTN